MVVAAARRECRRPVRKSLHEYQFSSTDLAALEKRMPQRSWTASAPAFHINHLREGGKERKREEGRKATCVCFASVCVHALKETCLRVEQLVPQRCSINELNSLTSCDESSCFYLLVPQLQCHQRPQGHQR